MSFRGLRPKNLKVLTYESDDTYQVLSVWNNCTVRFLALLEMTE